MDNIVQRELAQLIQISWIVLIPVGVLLALVLYKLAMLLNAFLEFVTVARHEVIPALQDLRTTAEHVEVVSNKVVSGIRNVEDGAAAVRPAVQQGMETVRARSRSLGKRAAHGVGSLWNGIRTSFAKKNEPYSPYRYHD